MPKKWYEKTPAQLLLIAVTLAAVSAVSYHWLAREPAAEVPTELVLSQTALALPAAVSYADGRFTMEIEPIPGNVERVTVRVVGPGGSLGEWRQGLGRRAYGFGSDEFFVDILSVMDDRTSVTDVTVSVLRRR